VILPARVRTSLPDPPLPSAVKTIGNRLTPIDQRSSVPRPCHWQAAPGCTSARHGRTGPLGSGPAAVTTQDADAITDSPTDTVTQKRTQAAEASAMDERPCCEWRISRGLPGIRPAS